MSTGPQDDAPIDDFDFDAPSDMPAPMESPASAGKQEIPSAFPEAEVAEARLGDPVSPPTTETAPPPRSEGPPPAATSGQPTSSGDVVFPPELLRQVGLSAEEAKAQFQSPVELERAVAMADRMLIRSVQPPQPTPPQGAVPGQPPGQRPGQQPGQAPAPQTPEQAVLAAVEKFKLNLDPNTYEKDVVDTFTGLNDHVHGVLTQQQQEIHTLREALKTVVQYQMSDTEARYYREFDETVNSLPEAYRETFGQGTIHDLERGSPAFGNRAKLDSAVLALQTARRQRGEPPLPLREAVQRAVRAEFPQQHDTTIRNQVSQQVKGRQRQFTQRPTGRRPGPAGGNPEQSAVSAVENFMRDRNFNSAVADTPEVEF